MGDASRHSGPKRDDFLLYLLSFLSSLKFPSLLLHSLSINGCGQVYLSPFTVNSTSDWSSAYLQSLKQLSMCCCFVRSTGQRGFTVSRAETAANVEIFTAALAQCTSLQELQLCDTSLSPSALQTWTSLQSLQSLSLVDVSVADSPPTERELQFISQLTNLTMLVVANSQEQQMGDIFSCISWLSNLQSLGVTCFQNDHFLALVEMPLLISLTVEFCNESVEFDSLQCLVRLTRVHHLKLVAKQQVRNVRFGQEISDSWLTTDGCVLQIYVTARNEEAAMENVGKMTSVLHVMIQDIRDPCNIRCLNGLPSHCRLYFVGIVGNEHLQQVARIGSLHQLFIQKYSGDATGLLWLKHMPNLQHVEFEIAVDDAILRVLPKKLLMGQPTVRDEGE